MPEHLGLDLVDDPPLWRTWSSDRQRSRATDGETPSACSTFVVVAKHAPVRSDRRRTYGWRCGVTVATSALWGSWLVIVVFVFAALASILPIDDRDCS